MAEHASTPDPAPVKALSASSLRRKLLVLAALLVLVPGVALTLLAERSARISLEGVIGRQLSREAAHTAERLSALLLAERSSLRSFARQDLMRDLRVGDVDKRVAVALATLRDGSPLRIDYLAVAAGGDVVTASRASLVGRAPEWLRAPAAWPQAEGGMSGPFAIPDRSSAALALAADIPDPDDPARVLGTLVALLDWARLMALAEEVRRDLAGQGAGAGVLVSRPDGAVIGGARSAEAGEEWIAGSARLGPGLPAWNVVVREPRSQALAPVRRLSRRLALTMGLALAGALLLATAAARRLVRPLGELTAAIRELARGEPGRVPVRVRGADEIAVLAAAFNDMASRLDRTQRDLVEAEKFAFVGELAAGVAHEIRTSLGVLGSSAQILERSLPPEASGRSAELAQMVRAEVGRLGGVVNDLLTLQRSRPLQLEAVPMSELLGRAVEFVAPQAREKGVRVELDRSSPGPRVWGDAELLHQVAVNLLVNAVQAAPAGGHVAARVLPPERGEGGFEVRDDGPGIAPELRGRVFEPFVTARPGGVGLGLTFAKRVVHEHRGSIAVEPRTGPGACLRVRLPLEEGTS